MNHNYGKKNQKKIINNNRIKKIFNIIIRIIFILLGICLLEYLW